MSNSSGSPSNGIYSSFSEVSWQIQTKKPLWTKKGASLEEKGATLDKNVSLKRWKIWQKVEISDKKGAALGKILVFNIVREINCKSPLQKAWPINCWISVLVLVLRVVDRLRTKLCVERRQLEILGIGLGCAGYVVVPVKKKCHFVAPSCLAENSRWSRLWQQEIFDKRFYQELWTKVLK